MGVFLPFVLFPFCFQIMALGCIKNRFLRWFPVGIMEIILMIGMIHHRFYPPSFDILGWKVYLWLMGSVLLGGVLALGAYILYFRRDR